MKKHLAVSLFLACLLCLSCTKEDAGAALRRETKEKITGKWFVEKTLDQEYHPIPTLQHSEEHPGTPEDYYYFKSAGTVEIGSAPSAVEEVEFLVLNPHQVQIGESYWWIEELTASNLILYSDRNDVTLDKRYVRKIYMKK